MLEILVCKLSLLSTCPWVSLCVSTSQGCILYLIYTLNSATILLLVRSFTDKLLMLTARAKVFLNDCNGRVISRITGRFAAVLCCLCWTCSVAETCHTTGWHFTLTGIAWTFLNLLDHQSFRHLVDIYEGRGRCHFTFGQPVLVKLF